MTRGRRVKATVHLDGNKLGALIGKAAGSPRKRASLGKGAIVVTVEELPEAD